MCECVLAYAELCESVDELCECVCVCEGRWEDLLNKSWSEGEAFGQETAVQDYHTSETTPVMWGRAARVVWVINLIC